MKDKRFVRLNMIDNMKTDLINDIDKILKNEIKEAKSVEDLEGVIDRLEYMKDTIEGAVRDFNDAVEEITLPIFLNTSRYVLFGEGYESLYEIVSEVIDVLSSRNISDVSRYMDISKEWIENELFYDADTEDLVKLDDDYLVNDLDGVIDLTGRNLTYKDIMDDDLKLSVLSLYEDKYVIENDKVESQLQLIEIEIIDTIKAILNSIRGYENCFYTRSEYEDLIKDKIEWIWR